MPPTLVLLLTLLYAIPYGQGQSRRPQEYFNPVDYHKRDLSDYHDQEVSHRDQNSGNFYNPKHQHVLQSFRHKEENYPRHHVQELKLNKAETAYPQPTAHNFPSVGFGLQDFHQSQVQRGDQRTSDNQHQRSSENTKRKVDYTTLSPVNLPDVKAAYVTPIPIISLNKQQALDGSYKSSYETGNSIIAEETGYLKNVGVKGAEGIVQFGSYSYTDPDGRVITVRYTADEGGFRAEGDHLPTPPPIPPEVQKGLDIIFESIRQQAEAELANKQAKNGRLESANYPVSNLETDDGSYRE